MLPSLLTAGYSQDLTGKASQPLSGWALTNFLTELLDWFAFGVFFFLDISLQTLQDLATKVNSMELQLKLALLRCSTLKALWASSWFLA